MISLETTEESIIQGINEIEFFNDNIYILDSEGAKAVLVFSKDGKYKYKIGKAGNGPGEYITPLDFKIIDNKVYVLTYKKLLVYDMSGKYLNETELSFFANNFIQSSLNEYVFYGSSREDRIIFTNRKGRIISSFINYSSRNRVNVPWLFQKLDSFQIANVPYCDTIYKIIPNAISPYLYVDFGKAAFMDKIYRDLPPETDVANYVNDSDCYAFKASYSETRKDRILYFAFRKNSFLCIQNKKSSKKIFWRFLNAKTIFGFQKHMLFPKKLWEIA